MARRPDVSESAFASIGSSIRPPRYRRCLRQLLKDPALTISSYAVRDADVSRDAAEGAGEPRSLTATATNVSTAIVVSMQ